MPYKQSNKRLKSSVKTSKRMYAVSAWPKKKIKKMTHYWRHASAQAQCASSTTSASNNGSTNAE